MKLFLLSLVLFISKVSFSQQTKSSNYYLVKYYYSDSTYNFKTSNIDTVRSKKNNNVNVPDSIETYRNGKLDGPKIVFSEGFTYKKEFKKNKLISATDFDSDGEIIYSSFLDSSKLDKTIIKFLSGKNYLNYTNDDTLIIINKTVPEVNRQVIFSGKGIETVHLEKNKYLLKMHLIGEAVTNIKLEIITILDDLQKKIKDRNETFIITVKKD